MSIGDIIVIALIALCAGGAYLALRRRAKKGCCGDCAGCSAACASRRRAGS